MSIEAEEYQYATEYYESLIKNIQDALGTAETGNALIEVARNAHKAEQEFAALQRKYDDLKSDYDLIEYEGKK